MSTRKPKPPRAPALLSKWEGPPAGELNDAAPESLVSKEASSYEEEKRFEEQEREIRWKWEDELCLRVRRGEVSIEAAIRAVGLHATIVQLNQCSRTEIRRMLRSGSRLEETLRKAVGT